MCQLKTEMPFSPFCLFCFNFVSRSPHSNKIYSNFIQTSLSNFPGLFIFLVTDEKTDLPL